MRHWYITCLNILFSARKEKMKSELLCCEYCYRNLKIVGKYKSRKEAIKALEESE